MNEFNTLLSENDSMINFAFVGDICLNGDYVEFYKSGINPFEKIEPILKEKDFIVGNLECIAKGEKGENILKVPRLSTTIETLNYLHNINLKVACLAQNHAYDHLEHGFVKTTDFLKENEIQYLGAGLTKEEAAKPLLINQGGIKIALLNYVSEDTNPNLPLNAGIYLNILDIENCKKDIFQLRQKVNHIVLSLHWGGRVEGGLFPDWTQPKMARELIDAGADLIIGHHSHTIQPYEIYKGKYIFYSLGNFCFSDYWFNKKFYSNPRRRMVTLIIPIEFYHHHYTIDLKFFENNKTNYLPIEAYAQVFKRRSFFFKNILSVKLFWNVYFLFKRYLLPVALFIQRRDISLYQKFYQLLKALLKIRHKKSKL